MNKLKPGQRLSSAISAAQVVVVRAPDAEVEIACGGVPMVDDTEAAPARTAPDEASGDGPAIGKRYADDELGLELLCTRPGSGVLTVNGRELSLKGAKPLPASD